MQLTNVKFLSVLLKGLLLLGCALSFWPYLAAAGIKGQTGDYSHVFIIPLIAAVIYLRSKREPAAPPRPAVAGMLLTGGIILRAMGEVMSWPLVAEVSFPLLFIGFVELCFGRHEARRIAFPALFLLFAFGFVTDVLVLLFVKWLMLLSAGAAYDAVTTFIPGYGPFIVAQNMIMVPPHSRFDVIEACAGIRGMLALFVIGSVIGYAHKLNGRQALRFVFLLTLVGLSVNLVRIASTIVLALLLREHCAYQVIHDTMNWVVFGPMIVLIPVMVRRAQSGRFRIGLIGALVTVMLLAYAGQWHLRASQGNSRLLVEQVEGAKPVVKLEIDQQGVPQVLLPYVSPEVDGVRHWRWILTSTLVHSNIAHLTVNVLLLLGIGHSLRRDLGQRWMAASLLCGQVSGALVGWWVLVPPPEIKTVVFMGASCAVSGLFGAYLVAHLLGHRKWVQAPLFLALFLAGMWLSSGQLTLAYVFSFSGHLAGLVAGMAVAGLHGLTSARAPRPGHRPS